MHFDRARFVRVCGLMTSTHEGEVTAAAMKASRMLLDAGLTWEEVLSPPPPPPPPSDPPQHDALLVARVVLTLAEAGHHELNPREEKFLRRIIADGREPTDRQRRWLMSIAAWAGVL